MLRPYQEACLSASLAAIKRGVKRMAVSLPVGSGKTVILSSLIPCIPCPSPTAKRTLLLAHRDELLQQAIRALKKNSPHLSISLDQGRQRAGQTSDVVVASVNSLGRIGSKRLQDYDPAQFKAIIIDEAHHAAAMGYRRILHHFKASKNDDGSHVTVWGCSATLRRHDGLSLGVAFDEIVYTKSFEEMIDEGWLSEFRLVEAHTTTSLKEVASSSSSSDFVIEKLSRVVNIPERNKLIVDTYLYYKNRSSKLSDKLPSSSSSASPPPQMRSTLVFAVDKNHIQQLVSAFEAQGILAKGLSSDTDEYDRRRILASFQAGHLPVLVNCGILTEGVDIPEIDTIMLARPTKSLGLLQQMVGRGLRKSPGKQICLVIDFVDTMPSHRGGIGSVATLLGIPPDFIKSDKGLIERFNSAHRHTVMGNASSSSSSPYEAKIPYASSTAAAAAAGERLRLSEFHDIFDLQQVNQDTRSLASISSLCWVRIGPNDFAMSLPGNKILLLKESTPTKMFTAAEKEKEEDDDVPEQDTVTMKPPCSSQAAVAPPTNRIWKSIIRTKKTGHSRKKGQPGEEFSTASSCFTYTIDNHISDHDCPEAAIRAWDAWVRRKYSHSIDYLFRKAKWRSGNPSASQLKIISRYIKDPQKLASLNKGQAADIAMRVILGGLNKFRKSEREEEVQSRRDIKMKEQLLPSLH